MKNGNQNKLTSVRHTNHTNTEMSMDRLRRLTDLEYHTALMLFNQHSNRDIAKTLGIELIDVYNIRLSIYDKLEVQCLVGLIKFLCQTDIDFLSYDDLRN